MEIQIPLSSLQIVTHKVKAVEPKISTLRMYNGNIWDSEEPDRVEWGVPIFATTTMGVFPGFLDGSQDGPHIGYLTKTNDYFGRPLYIITRMKPYDM